MSKVFVAGHRGMVGSAISRQFEARGQEVVTVSRDELDLTDQAAVRAFTRGINPDWVVVAAARVGGIHGNNTYPADFIYDNLMIEANLIHAAFEAGSRVLFLGSSCIYPKLAAQPMQEEALLTGMLEPTNEPYAIAKIAGIKLCESYNRQHGTDFRSVMPTNLYGTGDNFHSENAHVIPMLMRRFHEAKEAGAAEATVWGTGQAMREFLHVDDLAEACIHVMDLPKAEIDEVTEPMCSHINVGTGVDVTIRELAETIRDVVGFEGELVFDTTKPDGTLRKLLDVSKLRGLGWQAKISLQAGLTSTYAWFLANQNSLRT